MGARVFFNIHQAETEIISLYSHWGQDEAKSDLAHALDKARGRWDDESYGTRIIVSQLIGNNWDSETGYGLFVGQMTYEEYFDIYLHERRVEHEGDSYSFETFIDTFSKGKVSA
jgi:hypothetical protein